MSTEPDPEPADPNPIHGLFGLSYASYLVIPRSVLQSMPQDWQARFVAMVREIGERFDFGETVGFDYSVLRRGEGGRFVEDPFSDYERGRRRIAAKDGGSPC
jgi:hypothetical protein